MKAILKFNLPEDEEIFRESKEGPKWKGLAIVLREKLRSLRKYENKDSIKIEEIEGFFFLEMEERGLSLDD